MKAHHANKMLVSRGEKLLQDKTDNKNNLFILFKFKYYVIIHHKYLELQLSHSKLHVNVNVNVKTIYHP